MPPSERSRLDRQAEVAEAVWRVLDRDGFVGLSLRVVAAEMDATTGTVTHYFRSKRELADYALEMLAARRAEEEATAQEEPLAALRMALLGMLPLDSASRSATRIWVSSWDPALADAGRARAHARRYRDSRDKLAGLVAAALSARPQNADVDGDADAVAELLHAAMLGLATQAVLDPAAYPPERLAQLVDTAIARGITGPTTAGAPPGDSTPAQASGS
ncbi:TetR family transcriptional regulator [Microbacterium sp. AG790]|uniref:TetR/AcrR family transcriptional regulator n=1 Tax=Microbacterium sp. AG790 TaxID=2183995 RepID=UPI000F290C84|nr:TetR family transcriptional regulator C-terminal domain-containing protein [Microbacterium sp. AG790]RKS93503.1 TetR family transcriptional regulator [Microbacterium sp. AG790]